MRIVKIISTAIEKSRLIVKILGLGANDVKTVYNLSQFGINSRPVKNMRGVYADTGINGEKILIGLIFNNVSINEGETKIYSTNSSGTEQFSILLTSDGNCELGGNTDNLSKHSILQTQIHQLRDDFNSLVNTFNAHIHPGILTGGASTLVTTTLGSQSNIDITTAKIDNLKTN